MIRLEHLVKKSETSRPITLTYQFQTISKKTGSDVSIKVITEFVCCRISDRRQEKDIREILENVVKPKQKKALPPLTGTIIIYEGYFADQIFCSSCFVLQLGLFLASAVLADFLMMCTYKFISHISLI